MKYSLLLCSWVAAVLTASAEDWPVYQHDHHRSGTTTEALPLEHLSESWVYRTPRPPEPAWDGAAKWDAYAGLRGLKSMRNYDPVAHVIVVGNRLYFGSTTDDSVHCLDATTGKELWAFTTDGPVRIAPTWVEERIYFGSDDGAAYCLEAATGKLLWRFVPSGPESRKVVNNGRMIPLWPCRTGVLVSEGTAYFAMGMLPWKESYLCAVDALTGKAEGEGRYVKRLENVTLEGALLASKARIISPQGRVPPLLFDRRTGASLGTLDGGGGSFVLITDDERVLHGPGNKAGWVQESSEKDRSKIATFNGAQAIAIRGDAAFVLGDTSLSRLDRKTRKEVWRRPLDQRCALILAGETLFVGGVDQVEAFGIDDGTLRWRGSIPGRVYGLAVANGALFASSEEGVITCFRSSTNGAARANLTSAVAPTPTPAELGKAPAPAPVPAPPVVQDPELVGRWVFQRSELRERTIQNLAGGLAAGLLGAPEIVREGDTEVLALDGQAQSALLTSDLKTRELPPESLTTEAWVRVEKPMPWGGILGVIQDNGDFERGWILGTKDAQFCFGLTSQNGPRRLTYLSARTLFESGRWYHVAGTYDGKEMRIYVDGHLEGTSTEQKGPIFYPTKGVYEIGAYHDENENYPLEGRIREVRVYRRALSESEIAQHATEQRITGIKRARLALGPNLKFTAPDRAEAVWETAQPTPTFVEWGADGGAVTRLSDPTPKTQHRVEFARLRHLRLYQYSVMIPDASGEVRVAGPFEIDNFFNYTLAPLPTEVAPFEPDAASQAYADRARQILETAKIHQGICLVLDAESGRLAWELARQSSLRVIGVEVDREKVARGRTALLRAGAYGSRVTLLAVDSLDRLPFVEAFADLIVVDGGPKSRGRAGLSSTVATYLRPQGGLALLGGDDAVGTEAEFAKRAITRTVLGETVKLARGVTPGMAEWSHQYGGPQNAAFNGESLGGASRTEDLEVQWLGRPGPRAQPDRNGRKPSPLSTGGRLFVQGLQRIIALNAYNGTLLWSREIPPLMRFNMPRDCANWCADEGNVYAAIQDRCWRLDAATGEVTTRYRLPNAAPGTDWEWSYVAIQGRQLLGSTVKAGTAYTEYWGGSDAGWYDALTGPATYKVCSENLFSLDQPTGERQWMYSHGRIINSTISVANGRVYFVESRHPQVLNAPSDRLGLPELWQDLHLVALNLEQGRVEWDRKIEPAPGEVVFYLAQGSERLVLVSSGGKAYHTYTFAETTGELLWQKELKWPSDNHGGHMARPAIVGTRLFVRPFALELATGKTLPNAMPGGGCGTYAATEKALFFRNSNVTVWDPERGYTSAWSRLRPDCWLSTIPAAGLLLSPEGGGGCSCGSWMETSIVFGPRPKP